MTQQTSQPRYNVTLFDVESLAPHGLGPTDLRAWLMAPIAGEPLYRRLVEPLLGLRVQGLRIGEGPVGVGLMKLLGERPVFGLPDPREPLRFGPAGELILPGAGLMGLDLRTLIESAEALECPHLARGMDRTGSFLSCSVFVRPEACSMRPRSLAPVARVQPFQFWKLGSATGLIQVTRDALYGRLPTIDAAGAWRGGVLLGPRVSLRTPIPAGVRIAVGTESRVESGAVLGDGTIVGHRCLVGSGSHVENSVLLNGSRVHRGDDLRGMVRLPSGRTLPRRPSPSFRPRSGNPSME